MADLIDRQKTLEKIYQLQPFPIIDRDAYEFYRDVRESIKSMPSAQQWIPVTERLPEKDGEYLTSTIYGQVFCDFWSIDHFDRTETVLAWMPLPEPFKGARE